MNKYVFFLKFYQFSSQRLSFFLTFGARKNQCAITIHKKIQRNMHNMNDDIFMNDSTFDLKRRIAETIVTIIFFYSICFYEYLWKLHRIYLNQ